jgi:hydrogenase nickel incorporation protein HypA/HybF
VPAVHELGVALELVDAIAARAGGARVQRVVLEVGALSSVLPDALSFCLELATEGTIVEGAAIEVRAGAATARCRGCERLLTLARASDRCPCGAYDLTWLSGEALTILELEVT